MVFVMFSDRTDHNRFFVEHRLREIASFEARARGDNPQTAATAARVANLKDGAK